MSLNKKILNLIIVSCFLIGLTACAKKQAEPVENITQNEALKTPISFEVKGDSSEVVAKVNNTKITYKDLERMTERTLKGAELFDLGSDVQEKILQSMVASRVMAQAAISELDTDELETMQRDVRDYREQLLVKSYLKNNANPQPITQEMVKSYYEANLDKFGGGKVKSYELIAGISGISEKERNSIIEVMGEANKKNDWQNYSNALRAKGFKVRYLKGQLKKDLLDDRLQNVLEKLRPGVAAKIVFVDGVPYLPRVISIDEGVAKPLTEVSSQIRKILLPQQLKKSIKELSQTLLETTDVEYQTSEDQAQ